MSFLEIKRFTLDEIHAVEYHSDPGPDVVVPRGWGNGGPFFPSVADLLRGTPHLMVSALHPICPAEATES